MVKGSTKNCGCTRKKDITGQKIGKWEVIKKTRFYHDTYYWCKCECGMEKEVRASELRGGKSNSCGCNIKHITIETVKQSVINQIFNNNDKKYRDGNMSIDLFSILIQLPCFYCGRIGKNIHNPENSQHSDFYKEHSQINYNNLDRFSDNISKFHDKNNVVPACSQCNSFKTGRNYEEMLEFILKLKQEPIILTVNNLSKVKTEIKLLNEGKIEPKNSNARTPLSQLYPEKRIAKNSEHTTYILHTIDNFFWNRENNPKYKHLGKVELSYIDVAEIRLADCVYCGKKANLQKMKKVKLIG